VDIHNFTAKQSIKINSKVSVISIEVKFTDFISRHNSEMTENVRFRRISVSRSEICFRKSTGMKLSNSATEECSKI
jgi:hypothetical protein